MIPQRFPAPSPRYSVQCHCSLINTTVHIQKQNRGFLKKPTSFISDTPSEKYLGQSVGRQSFTKKKSLKQPRQSNIYSKSNLKQDRFRNSQEEHTAAQTQNFTCPSYSMTKGFPTNSMYPLSQYSSNIFNSQSGKGADLPFGKQKFQMEENIHKQKEKEHQYFRNLIKNSEQLSKSSANFVGSLEGQVSPQYYPQMSDTSQKQFQNLCLPNFYSHKELKSSEGQKSGSRQATSTIFANSKNRLTFREQTKMEDLKYKDTESICSDSNSKSQVISQCSLQAREHSLSSLIMLKKRRTNKARNTECYQFSKFRDLN